MRLIHTADWHLGQRFFGWDRIREQRHALEQLRNILIQTQADALLVAGDIFDTVNPSSEAEALYYDFLSAISQDNPSLQVIITAGNHDSPYRLKAPSPLLERLNIKVVSTVDKLPDGTPNYTKLIHTLQGKEGEAITCLALPFLRPGDFSSLAGEENKLAQFIKSAYHHAKQYTHPIVIMAHLYLSGASFRSIEEGKVPDTIGNEEAVPLTFFPEEASYIAFGHIHKPQQIGGFNHIRYAGSLLPNSFSEKAYQHGVVQIDIDAEGKVTTKNIEVVPPAKLVKVKGEEKEIKEYLRQLIEKEPDFKAPYLHLILESNEPRPDLLALFRNEIRGKYARLAQISLERSEPASTASSIFPSNVSSLKEISPLEVARLIYRENNQGEELPRDLETLFKEVVDSLDIS